MDVKVGDVFGRWKVVGDYKRKNYHRYYLCECCCEKHTTKYIDVFNLVKGKSKSCGCITAETTKERRTKHGQSKNRLFNVWVSMRARCNNVNNKSYERYGGRGIKVCKEWDDYTYFAEWAKKAGYIENAKYGECTLDRINVNGDYCPENCRWANAKEQANNKRNNRLLEYNGETHSLTEWADIIGIKSPTLCVRLKKGWTVEKTLTTPVRRKEKPHGI